MITLRKLEGLAPGTRARKLLALLSEVHDPDYDRGLVKLALDLTGPGPAGALDAAEGLLTPHGRSRLRGRLSAWAGIETADWDLQAPPDGQGPGRRFPFSVWLDDLRSPFNVGSIVRTAEAYGFTEAAHSPDTPGIAHPRTRRTAMGAEVHLNVRTLSLAEAQAAAGDKPVFALELGGTPVDEFAFPAEGWVLVGSEELGLSPEALAWADQSWGRVSLPLYGNKASLNVGVAFGVLAAAWTSRVRTAADRPRSS